MKYTLGERDYKKMRDAIVEFANESRILKQVQRGPTDMDVDVVDTTQTQSDETYTEDEWKQYQEHIESELYYMGVKGKGKRVAGTVV